MNIIRVFITILTFALYAGCTSGRQELNVMTFNIRLNTSSDGFNEWTNRKEFSTDCIKFYDADIVGLQEVLHGQLEDLKHFLPEYEAVGVARQDGKTQGEYSAVMYKKERFEVFESQTFWLSEDPAKTGAKGWDAACERIVTWAYMKDRQTGKKFYVFNTHFDHRGNVARRESSKLLLSKIQEIANGRQVIVTGDFNSVADDEPIKIITDESNPNHLTDTRKVAPLIYGPDWSFHGFGRTPTDRRNVIDYIFIKGNIETKRYGSVYDTKGCEENTLYLSDHNPVICTLIIK
ncbi:MAG: endonuclease/exonuclease/phosphatase family protein [Prevotellaceae bacterium]|jgi:endonuclease/exonuclease/phosphatase family metal-dependent hydrolase|nr:endonuclease/exonuclease/phosphatase family protein [Prevotellaceae bacterium]